MQFFNAERVREAILHLNRYESGWVIGPFVYACNGIDVDAPRRLRAPTGVGTDDFLDRFFHPRLLGLAPKGQRESMRPVFREMGDIQGAGPGTDMVMHQATRIWGNVYSQRFSSTVVDRGLVEKNGYNLQLRPAFKDEFEDKLPASFRFEELLVWLHAFSGFPDDIAGWPALWQSFKGEHLNGRDIPAVYVERFSIRPGGPPWPVAAITPVRPTNRELVLALMPSAFTDPITVEQWRQIAAMTHEALVDNYDGVSDDEAASLARSLVASLAATKRVFLLGDPGTGKTKLARVVVEAFCEVLGRGRVHDIEVAVTGRTTETSLMGFPGLGGEWVNGELTATVRGKRLFIPDAALGGGVPERSQVNVITLNEANRTDVEALVARLQKPMDSPSQDPADDDFLIQLGGAGPHRVSPWTYLLMTGNSPRDDAGRTEQSRPLQRRVGLLWIPNALRRHLVDDTAEEFRNRLAQVWRQHSNRSLLAGTPQADGIADMFEDVGSSAATEGVRRLLRLLDEHDGGASYAVLEKLVILTANELCMAGNPPPPDQLPQAMDRALVGGLSALVAGNSSLVGGRSLKARLADPAAGMAVVFPAFAAWAQETLSDISDFGTVDPFF